MRRKGNANIEVIKGKHINSKSDVTMKNEMTSYGIYIEM